MANKNSGRGRRLLFAPISFLLIIAAMLLGMSVFFRVTEISVTGAAVYTSEEIITASGIEAGDNLFFINRFKAAANIRAGLPYIENVKITRGLPGRINIEIYESAAVARLTINGEMWGIDNNCKILGRTIDEDLIEIIGISSATAILGSPLTAESDEEMKIKYLASLISSITAHGLQDDVSVIDISNPISPTIMYAARFTVKTGKNENLDYKLELLLSCVEQLSPMDAGIIDLSIDNRAHFMPD